MSAEVVPDPGVVKAQEYWDQYEPLTPDQIVEVLRATGFEYCDELFWREDYKGRLFIMVNCNDLFFWGTADCEMITPDNYQSLIDIIAEITSIKGTWNAQNAFPLWCCRNRKSRPQKPYYKYIDEDLHELFNACGPERDV
jgi:hypothetical protein